MILSRLSILILLPVISTQIFAATIVIQNNDGANEGFNDPLLASTISTQKGNNPGTTLGAMRLNVFEAAAEVWEGILNSDVTITVAATFDPLSCGEFAATLGSAYSTGSYEGFSGSEAGVAYHVALAESLKGSGLNSTSVEIGTSFNSDIDADDNCLGDGGFYYGLDNNAPAGTSALFPVVLHELGHGLGFSSLTSSGTGAFTGAGDLPDAFSRNLLDLDSGKSWDEMSNGERFTSARNEPALVWKGAKATADRDKHLGPAVELAINAPGGIVGVFDAVLGDEPTIVIPASGVSGGVLDGNTYKDVDGEPVDGCAQIEFGADFTGKVVLFDMPALCGGSFPSFFAQSQGAAAVIVAATTDSGLADVSGQISNQDIIIPYIGVEKSVGVALRANLASANVTIRHSTTKLMGENQGKVKMYAPAIFDQGSSVSHWSTTANPDLLMEPSLGALDYADVDLTAAAFRDIGWSVNIPGAVLEVIYKDGFE